MAPKVFRKAQIMAWNNNKVTDHNRGEVTVSVERIEQASRMANGTQRKYVVADKRTFDVAWTDLPHSATFTVDGFWGGREIETFYSATPGPFNLKLNYGDGTNETVVVMFADFSKSIKKRGAFDFWDLNVSMEEV